LSDLIRLFTCISNRSLSDLLVDRIPEDIGLTSLSDFTAKTRGLLKAGSR
jgi:hypothetical protein